MTDIVHKIYMGFYVHLEGSPLDIYGREEYIE
jgi:hypothetical protein